jgi:hypothetical protein
MANQFILKSLSRMSYAQRCAEKNVCINLDDADYLYKVVLEKLCGEIFIIRAKLVNFIVEG